MAPIYVWGLKATAVLIGCLGLVLELTTKAAVKPYMPTVWAKPVMALCL